MPGRTAPFACVIANQPDSKFSLANGHEWVRQDLPVQPVELVIHVKQKARGVTQKKRSIAVSNRMQILSLSRTG